MIAKAKALRYACCTAGFALLCLAPALAHADGRYLTWRSKAGPVQAADAALPLQAPQVAAPPSPYGQVGDPYVHVLTWATKGQSAQAQAPQRQAAPPIATAAPMRRAPVQTPVQPQPAPAERMTYAPTNDAQPSYQPSHQAPAYRITAPQYRSQPMASTLPEPVEDAPARQPVPTIAAQTAAPVRQVQPQPVAAKPAPMPQPAPVATASASSSDTAGYQVPATSPYAARIAAARAAQARAQATTQAAAAPPAKSAAKAAQKTAAKTATAAPIDAPVTETAKADDKPFVPGQHYTDDSEAPRLYSLHRSYGLKPDPITADTVASGAILDTSRLDAAQAKADKAEKAEEDMAGDDPEADSVAAKSTSDNSDDTSDTKTKAAK